jgi:hypothetical protein
MACWAEFLGLSDCIHVVALCLSLSCKLGADCVRPAVGVLPVAAVVPPGYIVSSGSMVLCSSGTFREGWLMFSDPRATTCTACGDNILSEPRDLDENPLAANGSLVRATSTSCCKNCLLALTPATARSHT